MNYISTREGNRLARSLTKALTQKFPELKLADALEAVAASQGHSSWNSFSQKDTSLAVDMLLAGMEKDHMQDAQEADMRANETGSSGYGPEVVLRVHTGFQLRTPAHPTPCSYLRVCDPLGREIAYWVSDEWRDDPEGVIGAVIGALARGDSWQDAKKRPVKKVPQISDVNFMLAGEVIFNDRCHTVQWRDDKVLALLTEPEGDLDDGMVALELNYEESAMVWEDRISLLQLRQMRWDQELRCFVTPDGIEFKVFYALDFADTVGM